MPNSDDFEAIKKLCDDYYQQRLTKEEYRAKRSEILNNIDREFNRDEKDAEGFINKMLSVFKGKEEEKIT